MNTVNDFENKIEYIVAMLQEKGYNPYEQLACYVLLQGNKNYITSHGGARNLIRELDINDIYRYLKDKGINFNEFLRKGKYDE